MTHLDECLDVLPNLPNLRGQTSSRFPHRFEPVTYGVVHFALYGNVQLAGDSSIA